MDKQVKLGQLMIIFIFLLGLSGGQGVNFLHYFAFFQHQSKPEVIRFPKIYDM